jgi:hypothetical protein
MAIGGLSEDWNDVPGVELKGLRFEVTKGDSFVVVGGVYALEGPDGLRGFVVVVEVVGKRTVLALGDAQKREDREEMKENHVCA